MKTKQIIFTVASALAIMGALQTMSGIAGAQTPSTALASLEQKMTPKRTQLSSLLSSYKKNKSSQTKQGLILAAKDFQLTLSTKETALKKELATYKTQLKSFLKASKGSDKTPVESLKNKMATVIDLLAYLKEQRQEAIEEILNNLNEKLAEKTACIGYESSLADIYFLDFFGDWLIIYGTDCSDTFALQEVLDYNGFTNYSIVTKIYVYLQDGSDTFSVEADSSLNNDNIELEVSCGDGNDSITTDKTIDDIDCSRDEGDKTISTGKEDDEIAIGGSGTHSIDTGSGNDVFTDMGTNFSGTCTMDMGKGDDMIDLWASGSYTLHAGSGNDEIWATFFAGSVTAYLDSSSSLSPLGTSMPTIPFDPLSSNNNNNDVYDGAWDAADIVYTSAGSDTIDFEDGADTLHVQSESAKASVDLGLDTDIDTVNLNGNKQTTITGKESNDVVNK